MIHFQKYIKLFIRNYPNLISPQQFEDLFRIAGLFLGRLLSGGGPAKQIPSPDKNPRHGEVGDNYCYHCNRSTFPNTTIMIRVALGT